MSVDGFGYFSLISITLFSNQDQPCNSMKFHNSSLTEIKFGSNFFSAVLDLKVYSFCMQGSLEFLEKITVFFFWSWEEEFSRKCHIEYEFYLIIEMNCILIEFYCFYLKINFLKMKFRIKGKIKLFCLSVASVSIILNFSSSSVENTKHHKLVSLEYYFSENILYS